jgi:hypothetical protein
MAGFLTDYTNNKILDSVFGASTFTAPATLYLGLSQISSNKGGTVSEPSGGGYARVAVSNNLSSFPAASGGTKSTSGQLTFPNSTAAWGTIQSLFVADAAAGGNVLAMADLTAPQTISSAGSGPKVAAGALFLSHT